jgi:NAD+ diphosphatase
MGLEGAVAREVREETGIDVSAVHYHYGELDDARWSARDWLSSHVDDDSFRLPRLDSTARRLIEDWLHSR